CQRPAVHGGAAVRREYEVTPRKVGDAPGQDVRRLFGQRHDMRPRLAAPTLAVVERDHASVQIHVRAPQPQELRRTLATDMDTDLDGIAPGIHRLSLHALEERGELALVKIPGERAVVLRERIDGS